MPVTIRVPSATSMTRLRPSASPRTPPARSIPVVTIDATSSNVSISGRSRTADCTEARPGEKIRGARPAARRANDAATSVCTAPGFEREVGQEGRQRWASHRRMLAGRVHLASGQPAAGRTVDDIPAHAGQFITQRVGARVGLRGPCAVACREERHRVGGDGCGLRRGCVGLCPDAVQVESQHEIGVEDEPAPLVLRTGARAGSRAASASATGMSRSSSMAATNRSWRAQAVRRQRDARCVGAIRHRERLGVARPVPGDPARDPDRAIPGRAGAEDRRRGPRPVGRRRTKRAEPGPQRPERRGGRRDATDRSTRACASSATSAPGSGAPAGRCHDRQAR